jgi:hypothetical protein
VDPSHIPKRLRSSAGTSSAEVQPPFQAVPGLEVLYGGLGSLWRLPLQQSSGSDALFERYLAAHPLSAVQNRTLAKPKPPTPPGFGAHMIPLYISTFSCLHGRVLWQLLLALPHLTRPTNTERHLQPFVHMVLLLLALGTSGHKR